MSRHPELYQWIDTVVMRFPPLTKPQAVGLALWSFGMILARSCRLTAVADLLAPLMGRSFNTLRERLRDTYREASAKAGDRRAKLDVTLCWAPWLAWVLDGWPGTQLAVAIDATSLGDLFVVLAVSVVYRGCAVPVAWKVLKAGEKHAWKPEWQALLEQFRGLLPAGWTVIVLADRGLYAKWLFEAIAGLGWHPFLRVNGQGRFRPEGWFHWKPLSSFVPSKGDRWQGRGTAFNGRQSPLGCTLLAYWGEAHQDPWLVLTDLPPGYADACWYGLRAWIEQGFKRCKRGGWQWQHTRMGDPARAERLWMAIAIATWWLLSVGGEAEAQADTPLDIPTVPGTARRQGKRWRIVGVFQHGWSLIVASLLSHRLLPVKPGRPEGWPGLPEINGSTLAISMAGA
ncbi:MAG: transposase [Methylococcus sp.]